MREESRVWVCLCVLFALASSQQDETASADEDCTSSEGEVDIATGEGQGLRRRFRGNVCSHKRPIVTAHASQLGGRCPRRRSWQQGFVPCSATSSTAATAHSTHDPSLIARSPNAERSLMPTLLSA
jgi:hypothetical protein